MDTNSLIIYLACIIIIFLVGKVFIVPLKIVVKLVLNSVLGAILIYGINFLGEGIGFHIGLNIFTAIFVGILGIPRKYLFNYIKKYFRRVIVKRSRKHFLLLLTIQLLQILLNFVVYLHLIFFLLQHNMLAVEVEQRQELEQEAEKYRE